MKFDVLIEYVDSDKSDEYFYDVLTMDVLPNGFFRIAEEDKITLIHPDTVLKVLTYNMQQE